MNMMKKNGGFTLVELIVVIAILAILAGIAVPAYSGYITKANEAADYTMLDAVKTAAFFAAVENDNLAVVTGIEVGTDATAVEVTYYSGTTTAQTANVDISSYVGNDTLTYKSDATGATWDSTTSKWTLTK